MIHAQIQPAPPPHRALLRLAFTAIVALLAFGGSATEASAGNAPIHRCGNLIVTPQSDNVLLHIRTRGIGCRAARRKLLAWAKHGYRPQTGPRGYRCKPLRQKLHTRCHRTGHRLPVIIFESTGL